MHFAGVCTEPDPRQAAVMSNFGISLSAAAVISSPAITAAATREDLNRNMTSFQTRLSPKDQRGPFSTDQLYPSSWTLGPMSALGQKQTFCDAGAMSALPPKADMDQAATPFQFPITIAQ